jgi:hypothetical protein
MIAADTEAVLGLGQVGRPGRISVYDDKQHESIKIDGRTGDIILQNADCAEDFDVPDSNPVQPGTVMVLGGESTVKPSTLAYDKRVAGVVSGAGYLRPGIILGRKRAGGNQVSLALMGRVFCMVDASYSPIEVGDLLTTSPTAGHAMKASDLLKGFGAVLGKALRPLNSGMDLIPILITLQ